MGELPLNRPKVAGDEPASEFISDPDEVVGVEYSGRDGVAEGGAIEAGSALPEPVLEEVQPRKANIEQIKIDELATAVDRLTKRLYADQEVIGRMQSRIESLQGDQIRTLLGPVVAELANLHAAFAEAAERDYERLGFDRVRTEFALLGDHLDSCIDMLGASSVGARVGDVFDSRLHQAIKTVPTGDAALDKSIAQVARQGFTFDPNGKPLLHARVSVYVFDPVLNTSIEPASDVGPPVIEDDSNSCSCSMTAPPTREEDSNMPYPLDNSEE